MTLEQTRQLGIEFERRVQVMNPDTEYQYKLDTETIYSFLNQYQDKFVHDIYKSLDKIESPSKVSQYVETILQGLLSHKNIPIDTESNIFTIELPDDFGLYINSTTKVDRSYGMKNTTEESGPSGILPNILISQQQAHAFYTRPQDNMRIIRQPIAFLSSDHTIDVICDKYTNPTIFGINYYKIPRYMDLMTSTPCELPMDAFDDIVSGAVDLYVQYAVGVDARRAAMMKRQQEQNNNAKNE